MNIEYSNTIEDYINGTILIQELRGRKSGILYIGFIKFAGKMLHLLGKKTVELEIKANNSLVEHKIIYLMLYQHEMIAFKKYLLPLNS